MRSILIVITLLVFGQVTFCQDWISVGTDSDGGKWFIKSTYVKKEGFGSSEGSIRIWTKKELNRKTIKKGGKSLTYTNVKELQLIVVDCGDKKIKFVTTTVYNSQGKVIDSFTLEDYEQEWHDVVPDSIGEAMLDKVCVLFN